MTHVCARWRAVGLDMSTLWADTVFTFPYETAIKTILARTKATPLRIDFNEIQRSVDVEDMNILTRARVLIWDEDRVFSQRNWSSFPLNQTFPYLQHLEICFGDFMDIIEHDLGPLVAPALKRFETNVPLMVEAPLLVQLRTNDNIWRVKLLLEYLKGFPLLVEVWITGITDDAEHWRDKISEIALAETEKMDQRIACASTIELPCLKSLALAAVGPHALSLLSHMKMPALIKFVVLDVFYKSHLFALFEYLDLCNTPRNVLTLIHCCDEKDSLFFSWTETDPYFDVHDWEATTLSRGTTIRFNVCGDYVVVPDILKAIPSSCDIHTLALKHDMQECDEDGTICQGSVEWNELDSFIHALSVFRNVTTLYLIGYQHADVGLIICSKLDAAECSFPALRELVLDLTGVTYKTWWDDLRTGLLLRQTLGRQVDCLTVRGKGACHACPQSDGEKRRARGVVERAVCDGDITEWLEGCCLITLKEERQLVGRVIDERSKDACLCLKNIWAGTYPWDFS